jgi:hypothetical protein
MDLNDLLDAFRALHGPTGPAAIRPSGAAVARRGDNQAPAPPDIGRWLYRETGAPKPSRPPKRWRSPFRASEPFDAVRHRGQRRSARLLH